MRVSPCMREVTCFTVGVSRSGAACDAIHPARPCGTGLRVRPEQGHGASFRAGRRSGHVAASAIVHWQTGRAAHGLDDACTDPALPEATHDHRLHAGLRRSRAPFRNCICVLQEFPREARRQRVGIACGDPAGRPLTHESSRTGSRAAIGCADGAPVRRWSLATPTISSAAPAGCGNGCSRQLPGGSRLHLGAALGIADAALQLTALRERRSRDCLREVRSSMGSPAERATFGGWPKGAARGPQAGHDKSRPGSAKPVNAEPKGKGIRLSEKKPRENFPKGEKGPEFFDLRAVLHRCSHKIKAARMGRCGTPAKRRGGGSGSLSATRQAGP